MSESLPVAVGVSLASDVIPNNHLRRDSMTAMRPASPRALCVEAVIGGSRPHTPASGFVLGQLLDTFLGIPQFTVTG